MSATTLLGIVAMLGLGTLLTSELPRTRPERVSMFATAMWVNVVVGIVIGLAFAVIASRLLGLEAVARSPVTTLLFAVGVALTSATLVVDQALVGMLRGAIQFWRNALFSTSKLALLGLVVLVALNSTDGLTIYATWVAGLVVSIGWLALVARRRGVRLSDYRPHWKLVRTWHRSSIEHHGLNLALQVPSVTMPLVAAVTISAAASAYYYTASLVTSFIAQGAVALTYALYAVCARDAGKLPPNLRFTLKLSGGIGALVIVVLILGASVIMGVFGAEYAANATTILQVLAIGMTFLIVKDHYVAISRIRGNVRSAAMLCIAGGALEVGLATCGAVLGGLTWLAVGQVAALGLEALVMAPTVIRESEWHLAMLGRRIKPARD